MHLSISPGFPHSGESTSTTPHFLGSIMSDTEARDAYLYVEMRHPNGQTVRGKSPAWKATREILAHIRDGSPDSLERARELFLGSTGIAEEAIADLSFGPLVDFMSRFFWALPTATPSATVMPAVAAGNPSAS